MSFLNHPIPQKAINLIMVLSLIFAIAIPFFFYVKTNRLENQSVPNFDASSSEFKYHIDECQVKSDHLLVKGWALIVGERVNTPTDIFVKSTQDNYLKLRSRTVPRPDVSTHFSINHAVNKLGFNASSGIIPDDINHPIEILIIKNDSNGKTYGGVYECK
ncbi:hypothetical protein [Phytohalomonas tamaricis]|uniref:hypothetical protein n=1 Tax=Phytohalomonas tamaricis TaxID=2081032 RepID=UPI00131A1F2E|nr:hypothetical protein [Phytohalomonas tamaricis]